MIGLGAKRLYDAPAAIAVRGLYDPSAAAFMNDALTGLGGGDFVVHVHGWAQILSPAIFAALRPHARRVVLTCHDFFLACPNGNYTVYPKARACDAKPMSLDCALRHCDKRQYAHKVWRLARHASLHRQLAPSKNLFRYLAIHAQMIPILEKGGVPASRIRVLPNPSDAPSAPRVVAENNREILYVGRLEFEKGADIAAAAARKIGARIRFVGDGRARASVEAEGGDAHFEGWRSRAEMARYFANARFLVAPSRCVEPFGLAAVEALQAGLPVVAAPTLLIARDLERLGMGVVAEKPDTDGFARAFEALLGDDACIRAMSERARAGAADIASTSADWLAAHLAVYDEAAREARG
ncbi:MAG: glycosyltransferase family 4 protein, partial [Parvularculaceae bacterium]|nr:glycosyltransferase family 4 protein [Parvularculaceae bacterium]